MPKNPTQLAAPGRVNSRDIFKVGLKSTFWLIILVIFASILGSAIGVGTPYITKLIIDDYIPDKNTALFVWMVVALACLLLLKLISTYIFSYFGRILYIKVEFQLRERSFIQMERIKVAYLDSKNEGHFLTRINEDASNISQLVRYLPENIVTGLIIAVSSFTFVFIFSPILGGVLLGIFIFIVGFSFVLRNKFLTAWYKVRNVNEQVNMALVNSVAGVKESKIFLAEKSEELKFKNNLLRLTSVWKTNFRLYARWMTFNGLIIGLIALVVLGVGGYLAIQGELTVGELTSIVLYSGQIVDPINRFLAVFDIFMTAQSSQKRLVEFWNIPNEEYETGIVLPGRLEGNIRFVNVSFEYTNVDAFDESDNKAPEKFLKRSVIKDLSFEIKAGEKVAFVGETGSGKSTVLKLLLRFYQPSGGQILIDNHDISKLNIVSLRQNLSYLQQEPYMFFDTIESNVAFGKQGINSDATIRQDEVKRALKIAKADEFVNVLPQKMLQSVGPRGVTLSGGQKQRIAIARAILKDTPIVLFDEATSALDNQTEKEIQERIEELIRNKTAIFIAHRLSSIRNLDRIFVLKSGQIVESGTHDQLMKMKGYYYQLNSVVK